MFLRSEVYRFFLTDLQILAANTNLAVLDTGKLKFEDMVERERAIGGISATKQDLWYFSNLLDEINLKINKHPDVNNKEPE